MAEWFLYLVFRASDLGWSRTIEPCFLPSFPYCSVVSLKGAEQMTVVKHAPMAPANATSEMERITFQSAPTPRHRQHRTAPCLQSSHCLGKLLVRLGSTDLSSREALLQTGIPFSSIP